jgi:hypothetical protein
MKQAGSTAPPKFVPVCRTRPEPIKIISMIIRGPRPGPQFIRERGIKAMHPSREQIQQAAYHRWERRGRFDGGDRDDWAAAELDVTFGLNYKTVVEHSLGEPKRRVLGDPRRPSCRFCEQSPPRATFSADRPVVPEVVGNRSLFTRELCDECAEQLAGALDDEFLRFWTDLETIRAGAPSYRDLRAPAGITLPAYKALVRMALLVLPRDELADFTDTLEWVGNPDHELDRGLFGGTCCLAYQTHVPSAQAWVSVARRVDDDAPYPSALFFLGAERLVLQIHLPLCARDEDLDGTEVRMPERSLSTGLGSDLRASTCLVLPLKSAEAAMPRRFRLFW